MPTFIKFEKIMHENFSFVHLSFLLASLFDKLNSKPIVCTVKTDIYDHPLVQQSLKKQVVFETKVAMARSMLSFS